LPQGSLSLLTAYMKVGKTTFAYALALAVVKGQPFLNYPTLQGPVLILAVEEHARDVRRRLERFGLTKEDSLYLHTGRLLPGKLADIQKFVTDHGVRLVLLDTLSRYWDIENENDNAEVIRRVSPFLDLARETNTAVVLIHHERKGGGEDGRGIRGGSALFGLVDQSLTLDKRAGGTENQRVLKALGRYDESPSEVILELDGDAYRSLGTADEFTLKSKQDKILAALTDVPQTVDALADATGFPRATTQQILGGLGKQVARQGKGVRNDPFLYCRPFANSIPPDPPSYRAESNPGLSESGPAEAGVDIGTEPPQEIKEAEPTKGGDTAEGRAGEAGEPEAAPDHREAA